MQGAFNQLLQLLQQGIAAIFRFVDLVWTWAASQFQSLMSVPWQSWPFWKQLLLAAVIAGIAIALFRVVAELWRAGERILVAFTTLIGVFVRTLPNVAVAGLIALGGLWVLNNVDLWALKMPLSWQTTSDSAPHPRSVQ